MKDRETRNLEAVQGAIAALNAKDLNGFFGLLTDDTTSLEVYFSEPLGRDAFRTFLERFLVAYPDAHITTQTIIAQGDTVAVENLFEATFLGPFGDERPTGRRYSVREAVFFDLKDGKIHQQRIYLDRQTIDEQLKPAAD